MGATSMVLMLPAVALASLGDEQSQGQALIAQIQARTKTCNDLSGADLDHIGEYLMYGALGSTELHAAMNARMRVMLGEQGETRMHQLLGTRYIGCSIAATGSMPGGTGMMGAGFLNNGGLGAMMGSGDWGWMMGGNWQHMSRQDWRQLQRQLGIPATISRGGWSAPAIIAVTLCAALLVGLLAVLLVRHRPVKPPPTTPAS
jgi:hypothetical protein